MRSDWGYGLVALVLAALLTRAVSRRPKDEFAAERAPSCGARR
jgi:vacuolar-type H+-ATPase subunit I/STV1